MTIKRVKQAAYIRGIYFDGVKRYLNNVVGVGYQVYLPGRGAFQSDTLEGVYKNIMQYERITD